MKKVFFALAVVAMFSFAACGGNNEEAADTTAPTEVLVEDEAAVEDAVNAEATECTESTSETAEEAPVAE